MKRKECRSPVVYIIILAVIVLSTACKPKVQEVDFEPFIYMHSLEQLQNSFSDEMIAAAKDEMKELNAINEKGKYQATLESLDKHEVPEWYKDAKLCIFYDWGPYSIAGYGVKGWSKARYPDWYLSHMYRAHKEYHQETWGEDFQRDDFLPLFTAENFNAKEIVDLVKMSGAKYIVPLNKHHDGFCLWDSRYTQRDVVDMYPSRDLTAELVEECMKAGIYHGFYFSVEDYEYPMFDTNKNQLYIRYWSDGIAPDNAGIVEERGEVYGEFISEAHNRMLSGKIPVTNFIDEYILPQAKDYIDKYDPDILWFDGEWHRPAEYYKTPDIVAYFYNKAETRKEVASNDRLGRGTRENHGDFYTSETDEVVEKMDFPWEENRSMSESYGFNQMDSLENFLTPDELVQMLVRIVAKGGNLNLIVNPDGSGKVSQVQIDLLKELGDWLDVNGEAIYGTRPYEKLCDNTQLGQPVWYTMSKDSTYGYAIVFDWPKSETFICPGGNPIWESEVYLLGYNEPVEWVETPQWGLTARIPDLIIHDKSKRPCDYAWVLKFKLDIEHKFGVNRNLSNS